ncbi:ester cyclase [Nocardiopsis alkaliphila]|uniref:ester cyclase n=1 Tax=Nocardiopsis alkaliphila TaxID=225762 RepID=UPI0003750B2C|nr:ester cyclase [Nocardiopsis alkaliphila]
MSKTESNVSATERNKELCLSMVAAWNRWDLDGVIKHWADDVIHYSEDQPVDSDEMIQRMEAGLRAFPDLRLDVRSIIAEGDRVTLRITVTATNKDEFLGEPATGRGVRWFMVEELRFVDGKVVEHWDVFNYLPMLKDLGKVPADLM